MKKNIFKTIIAVVFIVGAIISFNVEAKAIVDPDPVLTECKKHCEFDVHYTCNHITPLYTLTCNNMKVKETN